MNNTIQEQQQQQQQQQRRILIFRAEWTALNICFSIYQLLTDVEWITSGRGIDDEDLNRVKRRHHPTTNSLSRAITTATSTSARRRYKESTKSQFNQCLGSFSFFFQLRVYSRCFNTIRILYTLFLRVNTFWLLTLWLFFSKLFLPGQNRQMDGFMYY